MKYRAHLWIWATVATTVGILDYNNIININNVFISLSNILSNLGLSTSLSVVNSNMIFLILLSYIIANIINDLDSPYSFLWRIFFFISIPAWLISVIIYRVLYPKSWNGIGNISGRWFQGLWLQMKLTHRVLFHTEIWLILLLVGQTALFSWIWIDNTYITSLNIGLTLGYLTHLVCDAISGKVPYPIFLRLIFIVLGIRKETYWLSLG